MLEYRDHLHQVLCLRAQSAGSGGHLLHQCRILLGCLVHLLDRVGDVFDPPCLLGAGGADVGHDGGYFGNAVDHLVHRGPGLAHQRAAAFDALDTGANQRLDFFRCIGRTPGQAAHFGRHHGKAPALLAGTRGFYRCIECQNIGLEGNAVNHTDDVRDLA